MRVEIVSAHVDPARGGAEAYLAKLESRLRAHGHEVGAGGDRILATVPHREADFYQPHGGLLHACIPAHYESMPPVLRLRRFNPVRRLYFRRQRTKEAQTIASAHVLALSPRVVADLGQAYPGAGCTLLRPGVDLDRFRPGGRRAGGRVLFVARHPRLKGLRTARAAAQQAGVQLVVARPGDDVARLYREVDALVHPTYYDTAALVVLEALASGIPPITTVRDGNSDLAVEGGGAALARPGDPQALAQAIEAVRDRIDPERARAVAERFPEIEMLDKVVACICSS